MKKWEAYTEQELQEMANSSLSNSQWIKKMGYIEAGGSVTRVPKEILEKYPHIDTSHFMGQGINKSKNSYSLLSHTYAGKTSTIKRALIAKRGHRCERCGLTEWQGQPIPLQVHHCNGCNQDNDPDNLQLLCPNCHSLTESYCGRNIHIREEVSEEKFVQALQQNSSIRQALLALGLSPKGRNYNRAYDLIEKYNINHLKK